MPTTPQVLPQPHTRKDLGCLALHVHATLTVSPFEPFLASSSTLYLATPFWSLLGPCSTEKCKKPLTNTKPAGTNRLLESLAMVIQNNRTGIGIQYIHTIGVSCWCAEALRWGQHMQRLDSGGDLTYPTSHGARGLPTDNHTLRFCVLHYIQSSQFLLWSLHFLVWHCSFLLWLPLADSWVLV